jgi:hypothetical protein
MRILSIGFPMPGPQVTNHTFANAAAFFDYDAIVVNPLAVSQVIEEVVFGESGHKTRDGLSVTNGPATTDSIALSDLLRDRREETAKLLAGGGVVVCIAHPNAVHQGVHGASAVDRYCWLPSPEGFSFDAPVMLRGSGTEISLANNEHPFAGYITALRGKLEYHAYFHEVPGAVVFARSAGGAAVGIELCAGAGRIVFLPAPARDPTTDQRYVISSAIQEGVRQTLRQASAISTPLWVNQYDLPGLADRASARNEARQVVDEDERRLASAEDAVEEIERYRALLWQEGRYGLEEPVRAALTSIGLRIISPDDAPAELRLDTSDPRDRVALLLEVEGSVDAVGMSGGHYRLRKRLEEAIAAGKPKRGLLVINGHRTLPPAERPPQHDAALRTAAETMRYCVATGEQLFHGVRAALSGDDETVRSLRERLLTTEGILRED